MHRKRWRGLSTIYRTQRLRPVQDVLRGWRLNIHKIYCYGCYSMRVYTKHVNGDEWNAYQWIVLVCLKSHTLHVLSAAAVKSVVSDALMASTWLLCPSTMCVQIKGEPTFICKSKNAFKHGHVQKDEIGSLTFPLKSLMEPPGVGSSWPAPSLEKTSPSSREIFLR